MSTVLIARPHPSLVGQMQPLLAGLFGECQVAFKASELEQWIGKPLRLVVVSTSFYRAEEAMSFEDGLRLIQLHWSDVPLLVPSIADRDKTAEYIRLTFRRIGVECRVYHPGESAPADGRSVLCVTRADLEDERRPVTEQSIAAHVQGSRGQAVG